MERVGMYVCICNKDTIDLSIEEAKQIVGIDCCGCCLLLYHITPYYVVAAVVVV